MYFFRRIAFYLTEAHQPNVFNNLPIETHFRIDPLAKHPAGYPYLKEQFHSMKGRLHELIHEQHIASFNLQPGFFDKLPNEGCRGCFAELSATAWRAPERVGRTNTPMSNHQELIPFPMQAADAQPKPVPIQFKYLFPRSVSYLRHGLVYIWGRKGRKIRMYAVWHSLYLPNYIIHPIPYITQYGLPDM